MCWDACMLARMPHAWRQGCSVTPTRSWYIPWLKLIGLPGMHRGSRSLGGGRGFTLRSSRLERALGRPA
jgi:hypothetical protein